MSSVQSKDEVVSNSKHTSQRLQGRIKVGEFSHLERRIDGRGRIVENWRIQEPNGFAHPTSVHLLRRLHVSIWLYLDDQGGIHLPDQAPGHPVRYDTSTSGRAEAKG